MSRDTKRFSIHECTEAPHEADIAIVEYGGLKAWHLCIEDYGDRTKINFCPYCGLKLLEVEVSE